MAENKMEQVAALFGKKLGERFTVQYYDTCFDCRFMSDTFDVMDAPPFTCCFDERVFHGLFTGEAVIVDGRE